MSANTAIESRSAFYTKSSNVVPDEANELHINPKYVDRTPVDLPRGLDNIEDENGKFKKITIEDLPASANPYFNIRIKTVNGTNYPLIDEESLSNQEMYDEVTAKKLIQTPRGASIYNPDDFLYCQNFGRLPLNRMITLRRFAYPSNDDIFNLEGASEPDISRLIGFFDQETNKLSELISFSAGLRWKPLQSSSERASMAGEQNGIDGVIGKVLKVVDPKFGNEAIRGTNAVNFDPQHDQNRVYGPVDSIADAMIRDVGLDFTQDMTVTFEYRMKSINGVNQKAAFIDLLANFTLMCTNDGKFWGGARHWVGVQPSKYVKDMKALSPKNFNDFVNKSTAEMKDFIGTLATKTSAKETLKNIANNILNLSLGKMLNVLGRPGIPVMNSLLTGNPIGPWHLTIGNPLNPILVAGDLIMADAEVTFGDELGYDDFPTTMKFKATLKHAKPRDRAGIEQMFNAGKGRLYFKPEDVLRTGRLTSPDPGDARIISSTLAVKNALNNFGEYSLDAIKRNAPEVWSFLKQAKT